MVYVESGKGSGNSSAGIGLYCLTADKEPRAEVDAAASEKDTAMVLFRDAVAMVDQSPALPHAYRNWRRWKEWNSGFFFQAGSFFAQLVPDDGTVGSTHDHIAPYLMKFTSIKAHQVAETMRAGTKVAVARHSFYDHQQWTR